MEIPMLKEISSTKGIVKRKSGFQTRDESRDWKCQHMVFGRWQLIDEQMHVH